MSEDRLTEQEKALFASLEKTAHPPKGLERKVLGALVDQGLIAENSKTYPIVRWIGAVAASVIFFIAGIIYEKSKNMEQIVIEPTKGYMLLLHEDASFQPGEPMQMFEEYKQWMENTFARGVKITGQELVNEASLVDGQGNVSNLDSSAGKMTTGYFVLEASSLEEALEVAKANPHVKYGGSVEVKKYMVR